jgi:tRNA (cmo5U34)-methyltransferase
LIRFPHRNPFGAATSLLVSQLILVPQTRVAFFRAIAERLKPGAYLVSADLASDTASANYASLLGVCLRLMRETGLPREQLEGLRAVYTSDVAVLPPEQVSSFIALGGFENAVLFLQTGLIHAWYAQRAPGVV